MNDGLANQPPSDWDLVPIGERFMFTNKPKGLRFEDCEAIPFVPMERIPSDRLFFSDFVLKKPQEISSGTYFEEGDLLVSKITPCFENGKQGITTKIPGSFGIATTEVIPIKAKEGVSHLPFLAMYLLDSEVRNSLAGKMEGATGRQRLAKSVLEEWIMPFPPLPEQRAIVAVLSKIQAAVELQGKIVATLKELKAATMAKLFREGLRGEPLKQTEIGEIPESWHLGNIDDVAIEKRAVVSGPFGSNIGSRFFVASGVPVIRGNNLTKGEDFFVDNGFVFVTEEKAQELYSCTAVPGDLIFTAAGTIGQVGLIPPDCKYRKYIISNKQLRARVDKKKADPLFLFYWFSSPITQQLFEQRRGGTSIPVINLKVLRSIPVPILSLDEQVEIARICHKIHTQLQLAVRKMATLKSTFSSMLHLLMTGQVRVNSRMLKGFSERCRTR